DPDFDVVAEETADLRQSAADRVTTHRYAHLAVIVPQIADLGAGADIDPRPEIAVAKEAVVVLVGVTVHNAAFDFAADAAMRAERDPTAQPRAGGDVRSGADMARPIDPAERLHHRSGGDRDRALRRIEHDLRLDPRGRVDQQLFGGPEDDRPFRSPAEL